MENRLVISLHDAFVKFFEVIYVQKEHTSQTKFKLLGLALDHTNVGLNLAAHKITDKEYAEETLKISDLVAEYSRENPVNITEFKLIKQLCKQI